MTENTEHVLTAYNVRTKEKNVPLQNAVLSRTSKGAYIAKGSDANGNPLTTLCSGEKAIAAVRAGQATFEDPAQEQELNEKYPTTPTEGDTAEK